MDLIMVGVIIGRSGFLGSVESRVLTPGAALRRVEASEGPASVLEEALSAPYREVVMDDPYDDFEVWSARSVHVLPVVCTVDHGGGFVESV